MPTSTLSGGYPGMTEKVSGAASQAPTKASTLGQMVADKVEQRRGAAADGMDSAATALHEKANALPGGQKVASAAHRAANALGATADYIRTNDVKNMREDLQRLVKNNPGTALLTAVALGFLVARWFSRN